MARSLNGTSDFIGVETAAVASNIAAMTLSAWVYPTTLDSTQRTILSIGDDIDVGNNLLLRLILDGSASHFASCQARSGTDASTVATGTTSLTTNTWFHICGVITFDGVNRYSEIIYTNGSDKQTNTNSGGIPAAPPTANNTTVGTLKRDNGTALFWAGRVADAAIWNIQLSDSEIAALAKGARPYAVRTPNLKFWWPLDGLQSPEPDLSTFAHNGTLTGTASAAGPPVMQFTPRWPIVSELIIPDFLQSQIWM